MYAIYLVIFLVVYSVFEVYFLRKRKSVNFPEAYPMQTTIDAALRYDSFLDYIWESFQLMEKRGIQTFGVRVGFIPPFVFTNNVENIQHILRDNFENYQKGPVMKSRFRDLLGDGIFNADGALWRLHRKTSAHLFTANSFKSTILRIFNVHCSKLVCFLKARIDEVSSSTSSSSSAGITIDIHSILHSLTLDSIGEIAFGLDLGSLATHTHSHNTYTGSSCSGIDFEKSFDYLQLYAAESYTNPFWWLHRYFTPSGWLYYYHLWRMNSFAYEIVKRRRKELLQAQPQSQSQSQSQTSSQPSSQEGVRERTDLLSLYLTSKVRFDDEGNGDQNDFIGSELSDKMLRDILVNFIIAGRDTTAQALSWCIYELSKNTDIQDRARNEVRELWTMENGESVGRTVGDGNPVSISYDCVNKMKYLEAICFETLRLYPSVPKEAKYVVKDDILPGDKFQVHRGDSVSFFPYVMGRTPALWGEDCLEFNPDRFFNKPKPSPFVFTSFQAGPRTCLGQNLAILEMKCVLARLLHEFKFCLLPNNKKPTYAPSLTLPIKGGLQVCVKLSE